MHRLLSQFALLTIVSNAWPSATAQVIRLAQPLDDEVQLTAEPTHESANGSIQLASLAGGNNINRKLVSHRRYVCGSRDCTAAGCCGETCCHGTSFGHGWRATVETIFLRRDDTRSVSLITDQSTAAELLNGRNLDFDHEPAVRVSLIRENPILPWLASRCLDWEIGFLGATSWDSSEIPSAITSPVAVGPGISFPSSAPGALFQASYASDLHSFEWNVRRVATECFSVVAGFRWVELSEDFLMNNVGNSTTNVYSIDTNNHLYGFQIGSDFLLWSRCERFHMDGMFRAGLFYNRADQATVSPSLTPFAPTYVDTIRDAGDETTFLGEIGITGVYDFSARLSLRAGYHLMWIEGVALAPEQLPNTDMLAPGLATLDTEGGLFYHGATVGFMLAW